MINNHATLLQQLHEYVNEYVAYLGGGSRTRLAEASTQLRHVIADLEDIQKHSDQTTTVDQKTQRIGEQLDHLRALHAEPHRRTAVSPAHQTLAQAFQDYFKQEIDYLAQVGGSTRRAQIDLLLIDIVADLKALALNPTDEQAAQLAADLKRKRAQVEKLQRPWQQQHPQSK